MSQLKQTATIIVCTGMLVLAACSKPPELRGYWVSENGAWMDFRNRANLDITMGGTFTQGQYKFNSATEIAFRTFGWEICTFKMLNEHSFFLSDCARSMRNGIYRYKRAKR